MTTTTTTTSTLRKIFQKIVDHLQKEDERPPQERHSPHRFRTFMPK
ncbi:MAG: hypothetical protein M3114_03210 [Thermoproteota archaeon]|nr:hypothetical protein [Thermoproteota archaeon]